jgi:hypothetical protein
VSFTGTVDSKQVRVWAVEANFAHFVTATPDQDSVPVVRSWVVGDSKIRRYPGDPSAFTRKGYTATRSLPVTRGRAIPGKPFVLDDGTEVRQFSFVGSLSRLISWLNTKVKADCMLYSPAGRAYVIKKTP